MMTSIEVSPYVKLDVSVVDSGLKPFALALYVAIARHVDRSRNKVQASLRRLAEWSNMGETSVQKYTKELEDAGLIVVWRQQCQDSHENEVNVYMLAGTAANTTCGDWGEGRDVQRFAGDVPRESPGNHYFSFNDDDEKRDYRYMDNFSEKREEKLPPAEPETIYETPSMQLLKKHGVRGKRLNEFRNYPVDLILKWIEYGEKIDNIRNFGGWLSENLLSRELPPEIVEKQPPRKLDAPEQPDDEIRESLPAHWQRGYDLLREFGIKPDDAIDWASRASIDMFEEIDKGWRIYFQKNPPKNIASYLLKMVREKKSPPYFNKFQEYTGELPAWAQKDEPEQKRRGKDYYTSGKWGAIIDS